MNKCTVLLMHFSRLNSLLFEEDLRVFAEAGRVVIAYGGGIAKTLEKRRRFKDLLRDER